jgi:outer membrane receptor for ferrienterochelin and colicin
MITRFIICLIAGAVFSINASAQNTPPDAKPASVYGNVFNQDGEPLIGATVQWNGTTIGDIADEKGDFRLPKLDTTALLLIQYVGYNPVYIEVFPHEDTVLIRIDGITDLETVNVTGQNTDNFTSTLDPINLESISSCELKKAACCNLAESFETNGAVDVMMQDAITSATEINMLGLRGIYTQLLMEKRPVYNGLGSPLALEYIPGTWVSGIQISKGTSTVQNGYQAIAGQINVELEKPWQATTKPFFLNLFGSTNERAEANLHLNKKWTDELSTGLLLHGSTSRGEFDRNGDTFVDLPKKNTLDGLFRTYYVGENFSTQFNVQALADERSSGQIVPEGADPAGFYRIRQENHRLDVFGKFGYLGFANPNTSMGIIYSGSWHETQIVFGKTRYNGKQKNFYTNLLYATAFPNQRHKLNLGVSYQYDDYEEFLDETDFSRTESVPGVFAEYVFDGVRQQTGDQVKRTAGFGLIAGARLDRHNQFGLLFTPRLNLKYNFSDRSIVRLIAGRGLRTAQILSENLSVLASNRELVASQKDLGIEDAWNFGLNFTQNFKLFGRNAGFVADLYRTEFRNQVVMDMESEHGKVLFYNLDGKSFSNSLLLLGSMNLVKGLNMKLAYKLNDVQITYQGELRQRPLNARHRALATLDYETPGERWMFNTNVQYTGRQRFAEVGHLPVNHPDRPFFRGYSPSYVLVNAQITRRFKQWEVYLGGENLTNFTQKHAIIDWQNPFGEYFDAMQVYAPLVGARGYVGVRLWLEQ